LGKRSENTKSRVNGVVLLSKIFAGLPDDAESLSDAERFMKMSVNGGDMVNRVGLSRKHIFDAVDASIARLGTLVDVLQIHRLDRETPREEIMRALNDVVESGKARYIGACSVRILISPTAMSFEI
jgi:aryl-alcohol dehydrogenase-like predicted oxidoreductase